MSRIYLACVKKCEAGFVADDRLGIDGHYSIGAQRMAALAGGSWPHQVASNRLDELCGIRMCANTIREIAQTHGAAMDAWQNSDPEACREFRETDGKTEFTTDGTCVNTLTGWREMKIGIFAKRESGDAATPDEWANRDLPNPSTSFAFGSIEASRRFGRKWKTNARRLGILDTSNVTVLADGAKWIWEEQLNNLRGASGVLDIFHAVEHIAETSRTVFGAETDEASAWLDEARMILIRDGWPGICAFVDATHKPLRSKAKRKSLMSLKSYLASHCEHLNYADRLASGDQSAAARLKEPAKT